MIGEMMKTIRNLLLFFCLLLAQGSCVQNGGNIGNVFGKWVLVKIEGDNTDPPAQTGDIYFSFQKDVIQLQRDNGHHSISEAYGLFRIDENILYLDFPEEDKLPFPETGFEKKCSLQILKLTSKEMELIYHISPDKSLIYYLKKW